MSKWLSDRIVEEAGRRIYESQQSRLSDQTTFAAKRAWRSDDVPEKFWDSYVEDARAALSLTSTKSKSKIPTIQPIAGCRINSDRGLPLGVPARAGGGALLGSVDGDDIMIGWG